MVRPTKPEGTKYVSLHFTVPPDVWSWLEEQWRKEAGTNRSKFVTQALVAYRQMQEGEPC